jgi:Zn-dependent peptidase ImmA (M78 family)
VTRRPAYDPFRELEQRLPDVFLCTLRLPKGRAWWLAEDETIVLDDRLDETGRRCGLAHEIEHALAGDTPILHVWFRKKQESRADQRAARKLIRIDDLIDALRETRDEQRLAELLRVDVHVLRLRLDRITDHEQHRVERSLDDSAA